MAEGVAGGNINETEFLKLVETVKEGNEKTAQLEKASNVKDNLIQTLQNALIAKEKLVQFMKEKLKESEKSAIDKDKDGDSDSGEAENRNENVRENIKGESAQVHEPQNSNSINSATPMEAAIKVGTIPLILNMVLKCMKNLDLLKTCRLVSREWRDLSTSILLLRKNFQIFLCRTGNVGTFSVLIDSKLYKPRDLPELTAFLTASKTFPCARFIFEGNLKGGDAQGFLDRFGSRIKGIKLTGAQNLNFIRKLLVEQIPLVESLELSKFVAEGNSNPNPNVHMQLPPNPPAPAPQIPVPIPVQTSIFPEDSPVPEPQLSSLTFLKLGKGNSPDLVVEILNAAPNLQECWGIRSVEEIECLRHSNRLDIVKGLTLNPGKYSSQNSIEKLKSMLKILQEISDQLHLTVFKVNYFAVVYFNQDADVYADFCRIVSKLLTWSQTTLKQLKFAPDSRFQCLIQWPTLRLEKVEKLNLGRDLTRDFVHLFPPAQVSKIFPNLHTIHFKDVKSMTEEQMQTFKNLPPIHNVKSLFVYRPNKQILTVFAPLLPNVAHLSINGPEGIYSRGGPFPNWAPIIWQLMRGVKSLQVELHCPAAELDPGFTGMEENTCKVIRNLGGAQAGFQMEEIDKFRINPSILNLTELEELFLPGGFSEEESPKHDEERRPYYALNRDFTKATFVSFKYAFKLMPKLRVFPHADFLQLKVYKESRLKIKLS